MKDSHFDWKVIVDELGPRLYRYFCASFAGAQASDMVQETLIRLVQKCRDGEYQSSKGQINTYAFGIARYVRLEVMRQQPHFELVESEGALDIAVPREDVDPNIERLRRAIRLLKPIEQDIVLLVIDDELSLEEISLCLDVPLGTIKSHIHRAKENLRRLLEVRHE